MDRQLQQLKEFNRVFSCYENVSPTASIPVNIICLRYALIAEELEEYARASAYSDIKGVADSLADLLYVVLGTVLSHGLQDYIISVFDEVHRSNMSKVGPDGVPIYRYDGKVLKSSSWSPPDIDSILGE